MKNEEDIYRLVLKESYGINYFIVAPDIPQDDKSFLYADEKNFLLTTKTTSRIYNVLRSEKLIREFFDVRNLYCSSNYYKFERALNRYL